MTPLPKDISTATPTPKTDALYDEMKAKLNSIPNQELSEPEALKIFGVWMEKIGKLSRDLERRLAAVTSELDGIKDSIGVKGSNCAVAESLRSHFDEYQKEQQALRSFCEVIDKYLGPVQHPCALMEQVQSAFAGLLEAYLDSRAKLAEALKDKERLDFVQKHCDDIQITGSASADDKWWRFYHHDGKCSEGSPMRGAIDEAMKGGI